MEDRRKKLFFNTIASLIYQITTIVCGFILPRLILTAFGSDVNGLVNSITQFLSIISFLELGVGAVVQSSLYKPLAEHDEDQTSKVIKSANNFFRTIARILFVYVIFLAIFYPRFANQNFDYAYTVTLIVAISLSSFAQYYFGIVNRLLVSADQRGYIQYNAQTVAVLLNTFACFLLIKAGMGIQVVKLTTSLIYMIQPFTVYIYVRNHYNINPKVTYTEEPIKQKWNGIAQHVAAVVLDNTDMVVLTIFSDMAAVSIYSVYFLVVKGVKQLFLSMTNGIQSLMGELWAKREDDELRKLFSWVEWVIHTGTVFVWGVTAIAIVPFIQVYTRGVTDADYYQPLFAVLIVAANAVHCLRLPYNVMILAAGHYRQTQNNYIIACLLNVVISILAVKRFGLVGVAIGTLVAMLYQTVWMAWYDSKNFNKWPMRNFWKQIIVDLITVGLMAFATHRIHMLSVGYIVWGIYVIKVCLISLVIIFLINFILFKDKMKMLINKVTNKINLRKK